MKPEPIPTGFKAWFVFVGLLTLAVMGLLAWAVIRLVTHFT